MRDGAAATNNIEQSVVFFLPEDMEYAVLVNSWVGKQQASLRKTIADAYVSNLE